MHLYLAADKLNKGQPPKPPSTSGSGDVVDCPLGAACPKGGKHLLGSTTLIEHTEQAAKTSQTGSKPGDESAGKNPEKPGVTPASQNLGSLGASEADKKTVDQSARRTRRIKPGEIPDSGFKHKEEDTKATLPEFPAVADNDVGHENPGSKRKTLLDPVINLDRHEKQDVPNPLDANTAPADSKAIDHYRLSKVAKETGDTENAKKHEKLARERSNGFSSAQHKEISEQLKAEGLNDHSDFHAKIHEKSDSVNKYAMSANDVVDTSGNVVHSFEDKDKNSAIAGYKQPEKTKLAEAGHSTFSPNQSANDADYGESSANDSNYAVDKNKKTAAKAKDLKDKKEPVSDADHAAVLAHKSKAKKLRESLKGDAPLSEQDKKRTEHAIAALKAHEDLSTVPSSSHKKELNDLHANTKDIVDSHAKHAKEQEKSAAKEKTVSSKQQETTAKKQEKDTAKNTATSAKQESKKTATEAKTTAKEATKAANKKTAEDAKKLKEEAKAKADAHSPEPTTDTHRASVLSHNAQARQLRQAIETKRASGNLDPEDEQRAEHVLSALDLHENLATVPSKNHTDDLGALQKMSKDMAKPAKPEKAEKQSNEGGGKPSSNGSSSKIIQNINAGATAGGQIAHSATSPRGAGSTGSQVISYGGLGAVHLGHSLLSSKQEKQEKNEEDKDPSEVKGAQ